MFIIDPTVRWENNDDVGRLVQEEKQRIYESCYQNLAERYPIIQNRRCEVIGLWIGARGTISEQVDVFFERFDLDKKLLPTLSESVLSASVRMIHHHIYLQIPNFLILCNKKRTYLALMLKRKELELCHFRI